MAGKRKLWKAEDVCVVVRLLRARRKHIDGVAPGAQGLTQGQQGGDDAIGHRKVTFRKKSDSHQVGTASASCRAATRVGITLGHRRQLHYSPQSAPCQSEAPFRGPASGNEPVSGRARLTWAMPSK